MASPRLVWGNRSRRGFAAGALIAASLAGLVAAPTAAANGLEDAGAAPSLLAEDAGFALVPPILIADAPATYPTQWRAPPVGGDVHLAVVIDLQGEVDQVRLLDAPDPLLGAAALEAATKLRFTPASQGGVPVAVEIGFTYHFREPAPSELDGGALTPPALLTGLVRTRGNRRPIALAHLSADTGESTDTDGQGRFSLALSAGHHRIEVRAGGHRTASFEETLGVQRVDVVYGLTPGDLQLYETVVRADRERAEVTRIDLSGPELQETPGTLGDPFRVIMLMPSVGSIASGVAYPIVRGAEPASTGYFIDGVEVPILYHLLLGPAVIHPDFIERVDFYPGAPPPEYGSLIGGVVEGVTAKPRDDHFHASLYLDFINSGAFVEVPIPQTGTDLTAAGRVSYTGLAIALIANTVNPSAGGTILNFDDYQLRLEQKLAGGTLRLFFFGSYDAAGADQPQNDYKVIQTVEFLRLDLRYRHPLWGGEGELGLTLGRDDIGLVNSGDSNGFDLLENKLSARALFHRDLDERWRVRLGTQADWRSTGIDLGGSQALKALAGSFGAARGSFAGAFAELTFHRDGWLLSPGLRLDSYFVAPNIEQFAPEPRLSLRRQLTSELTLKGGAGFYTEPPVALISLPAVELGELSLGLQQAVQLDVGLEWTLFHDFELNLDFYCNLLTRTIELQYNGFGVGSDNPSATSPYAPASHGYAIGAEVFLRHRFSQHWYGWLAYSLSRSVRSTIYNTYDGTGSLASSDLPYVFDQTHILNLVFSYQLPEQWEVGLVFHWNSGRPETGLLTSNTEVAVPSSPSGNPQWEPTSEANANRLPDFFRVDLRFSKTWLYDAYTIELYFDMLNASISQEVIAFQYGTNASGGLAKTAITLPIVLPYLGVKARY